jgi:hypothetical protein
MKKLLVCMILSMGIGCQTQSETSKQDAPPSDQGAAAQAEEAPAPAADAQVVTPGVGIGPFKLGETRDAVMAAMPDLVPFEQGSDLRLVDKGERYRLTFDEQGELIAIKVSLLQASATLAGGQGAALSSATPTDQILAALGCEVLLERRGGATAACGAGTSFVLEGPKNAPSIIVFTPAPAPAVP